MSDPLPPSKLKFRYIPNGLFVYAQLGRKPGAERSLSMLPSVSDLPGEGWSLADQQTWRTGRMGRKTDWSARARKLGSVTAIRSFAQMEPSRWLMTQVIPMADEIDAGALLTDLPARFIKSSARVTVTDERSVSEVTVAGCSATWAHEQHTTGTFGEGMNRLLAGTVGPVVFVVGASGPVDSWSWTGVISMATAVSQRILERNSN
jgi:hypothetical protein